MNMDVVKAPPVVYANEIFSVTCMGCGDVYLGGTGDASDPLLDSTYDPETQRFICGTDLSGCYGRYRAITGENAGVIFRKRVSKN